MDNIIAGINREKNIVNISQKRDLIYVYTETATGIELSTHKYRPWLLSETQIDSDWERLEGDCEYKWIKQFNNSKSWKETRREWKHCTWSPRSIVDEFLLSSGRTYFEGMKRRDVSILCFDIETTGLTHDERSKVLIISNTYRKGTVQYTKMFALDDYDSQRHMLDAWCDWVRKLNPSIMATYNGFSFDIPYMMYCAHRCGAELRIGRDGSAIELEMFESKFRQDQNRSINYRMPICFGRELVDLFFVIQKWDIGKKFSRYALKVVIKEAGIERDDRAMVNAGQIYQYWDRRHSDPAMWEEVKRYAEHDADDTLAVYDLVGDAYFYPTQLIPMTFERVCMSASGAQINSMFVRAYLSEGHSIPKPDEKKKFRGAISLGNPGIYCNVMKWDLKSMYPSIILQWNVYDRKKDPKNYMIHMVKSFREQRLIYKAKAKEDPFYAALDGVAKGFLNSFYGFCSTSGLHFNSQECAEFITGQGREILLKSILWACSLTEEDIKDGRFRKQTTEV